MEVIRRCTGTVFIASLYVDAQMVAAQLCLAHGRNVYSALTAMDPAYQARAPGHVLLQLLLDELGTDGHESLSLGRTTPSQRSYKDLYNLVWSQTLTFEVGSRSATTKGVSGGRLNAGDCEDPEERNR
ncbi:GNAT family N-acetyltransferase [Streptomyces sp. NPDC093149]|uniref:GNAT family N-acetyltransferase n=1 Tax=Streptomyces sp. NPDC093149 TaxID=3366031 RepID=UPI0037FA7813